MQLTNRRCAAWWLLSRIYLTGLRDTQIAGKASFLGVSVKLFSEDISIWVRRLKKVSSHQCRWISFNLLRDRAEQTKRWRKGQFTLSETSIFSYLQTIDLLMPKLTTSAPDFGAFELGLGLTPPAPWFLAFRTQTEIYHQFPCKWQITHLVSLHKHVRQFL